MTTDPTVVPSSDTETEQLPEVEAQSVSAHPQQPASGLRLARHLVLGPNPSLWMLALNEFADDARFRLQLGLSAGFDRILVNSHVLKRENFSDLPENVPCTAQELERNGYRLLFEPPQESSALFELARRLGYTNPLHHLLETRKEDMSHGLFLFCETIVKNSMGTGLMETRDALEHLRRDVESVFGKNFKEGFASIDERRHAALMDHPYMLAKQTPNTTRDLSNLIFSLPLAFDQKTTWDVAREVTHSTFMQIDEMRFSSHPVDVQRFCKRNGKAFIPELMVFTDEKLLKSLKKAYEVYQALFVEGYTLIVEQKIRPLATDFLLKQEQDGASLPCFELVQSNEATIRPIMLRAYTMPEGEPVAKIMQKVIRYAHRVDMIGSGKEPQWKKSSLFVLRFFEEGRFMLTTDTKSHNIGLDLSRIAYALRKADIMVRSDLSEEEREAALANDELLKADKTPEVAKGRFSTVYLKENHLHVGNGFDLTSPAMPLTNDEILQIITLAIEDSRVKTAVKEPEVRPSRSPKGRRANESRT